MQRDPEDLYELGADVPDLDGVAMLHHLEGFMDAGAAGRLLADHLMAVCESGTIATFDVDRLIDYRSRRPMMTYSTDHWEDYEQPELAVRLLRDSAGTPFLLLSGPEPDHEWELFAAAVQSLSARLGGGPLIAGAGMLMLLTFGVHVDYLTEVLPGILVFSLGLSITVAPLTAAILAGIDQAEAGIGSAVNNAVARVAGLIATVAIGAVVAAQFSSSLDHQLAGQPLTPRGRAAVAEAKQLTLGRPSVAGVPRPEAVSITVASGQASLEAFRVGIGVASGLVVLGGLIGAAGIQNPRRVVRAQQCPGGQLAGAPLDAAGLHATAA